MANDDDIHTHIPYKFVSIHDLDEKNTGDIVDVIGVVKHVSSISTLPSKKNGEELFKCDLTLIDTSGYEVKATLWGQNAKDAELHFNGFPIVAFKRLRINEYGGRYLSTILSTTIIVNPKDKDLYTECKHLREWWENT
jgi:replication factor A1